MQTCTHFLALQYRPTSPPPIGEHHPPSAAGRAKVVSRRPRQARTAQQVFAHAAAKEREEATSATACRGTKESRVVDRRRRAQTKRRLTMVLFPPALREKAIARYAHASQTIGQIAVLVRSTVPMIKGSGRDGARSGQAVAFQETLFLMSILQKGVFCFVFQLMPLTRVRATLSCRTTHNNAPNCSSSCRTTHDNAPN
jgi:hypothetical protein